MARLPYARGVSRLRHLVFLADAIIATEAYGGSGLQLLRRALFRAYYLAHKLLRSGREAPTIDGVDLVQSLLALLHPADGFNPAERCLIEPAERCLIERGPSVVTSTPSGMHHRDTR